MWFTSQESRTLDHCTSVDHKYAGDFFSFSWKQPWITYLQLRIKCWCMKIVYWFQSIFKATQHLHVFNTTFSFIIGFKWRHNHVTWKPKHLYFMYKDGVVYMQLVHASLIFRKLIYFIPDIPFYINLEHFWKLYGHKKMDARWSCVWKRALHFLF